MHTHDLAEWAQFLSLGTGVYAAGSIPVLLVGTVPPQWLVHAGHTLNRAIAATDHYLVPHTAAIWHALFTAREACRDAAALLILLTTRPEVTR